ncbi:ATP-dependent DNA helicase UvrD2 [Calidifontibacter sp. DB0510]|uniref:DNA 3'-5' helicase n=1 Tax=Metallococcus carri TaxID=1656884 RepID=A0A967B1X3_9MICO|nr:ATP-dependent DNA helicase UvrD2 [Metallococcus carri]NHN56484.1 ATP-dependent DNA helicase UvrD2 [Metallococcus carri]NOP36108.1 ATP-dependent DNA helicase UvrD2 [Calidifontibacter sp. DB2511S]
MTPDEVLQGLDPQQREVASQPLGPMCVLAGAGTGKTRAITHRIAYGVHSGAYAAGRVLAVTFTARAAGEMRTRLRGLGLPTVQARTFHAAALRQLHYFWPQAIGGAAPEVLSHKAPAVAEAGGRLRLDLDRTALRDVASEIEWAKVSMLTPDTYRTEAARQGRSVADLDHTAMARMWEAYEEVKTARGVIDFEDVLLLTAGILTEREDIARTVRGQYRHFVVDEYQDVNAAQQTLLDVWVGERSDVCVVGDPAQTIYSFTGASPRHLLNFTARHPGAQTVHLVRNYRSTPQVVAVANAVLGVRADGPRLQAQRGDGPAVSVQQHPDDAAEASAIAASVKSLLAQGIPASQIAILYRVNAQSEAFEQALAEAGISYLVRGGERFFQRAEVRNAIVLLRSAARSDDGTVPLGKLVRDVITAAGWSPQRPAGGALLERWQSLEALASVADDLAADPQVRIGQLVAELDRRASEQHAPAVEGVTLASLHAAKGLEWDAVFLAGCSDGLLPLSHAEGAAAIEEERRLLYVGLTRARVHLTLTWAAARNPGGRATRSVSRFLRPAARLLDGGGIPAEAPPTRSRTRKVSGPVRCRGCGKDLHQAAERKIGRCADCPPTYDEQTFEALRSWRKAVATAQSVPAFVVFTDATLIAIAERAPGSETELAKVSGVGARKLAAYGPAVLGVLRGDAPEDMAELACATTKSD